MDKHLFGIDDPKVRLSVFQLAVKRVYGWWWIFIIIVSCGVFGGTILFWGDRIIPQWAGLLVTAGCGLLCGLFLNVYLRRKASTHLSDILKSQSRCVNCGYQLSAKSEGVCPECGKAIAHAAGRH